MPVGGYSIEVHGLEELKDGLRGSRGGLRDLRRAYGHVAETAGHYVRARVPMGSASSKDGAGSPPPGHTRSTVRWGATVNGPWVAAGDERTPIHLLEFGGTSYWYRGGGMRGLIRRLDTAGGRSYKHKQRTLLPRDLGSIAARYGVSGHVIYRKPRRPLGNFIWNVGYRLRSRIGEELHFGVGQVCAMHDLAYEMPGDPALDIQPQAWKRGAA